MLLNIVFYKWMMVYIKQLQNLDFFDTLKSDVMVVFKKENAFNIFVITLFATVQTCSETFLMSTGKVYLLQNFREILLGTYEGKNEDYRFGACFSH